MALLPSGVCVCVSILHPAPTNLSFPATPGMARAPSSFASPPPPTPPTLLNRLALFNALLGFLCREVFKAKHRQTGKKVALKKVLMENEKEGVSECLGVRPTHLGGMREIVKGGRENLGCFFREGQSCKFKGRRFQET